MTDEKRKANRGAIILDATWEGEWGRYKARVSDISEGGCYLDTMGRAGVGETLRINVQIPHGNWVALKGIVAHIQPALGLGIRFADLTEEQRGFVGQLMKAAKPE